MRKKFPSKRRGLALAVMVAAAGTTMPLAAQQSEPEVEEVIVTGSYIRGSALDAPSPVNVINRESIQAQGASSIWDVIRNLEYNQGSDTNVQGALAGTGSQNTGTASVNLRNLGGNSTLTLINGKRSTPAAVVTASGQESVNLNSIPLVMTERVEVLTDGGSALYGADAVAGVVNIIMRTDFDGLELYADTQGIQEAGGTYEETLSGIWGTNWNNGNTRLVISGEYFERDPQKLEHAQYFDEDTIISNSRVGSFAPSSPLGGFNMDYLDMPLTGQNKAERASIGEAAGGTRGFVYSDPLCESGSGNFGQFYVDNRYTGFARRSGQCSENNMGNQFMTYGQERYSVAGSFEHDFSDGTEFYSFFNHSDSEVTREWDGRSFSRTAHIFWSPSQLGSLAPFVGNGPATPSANNPHTTANGGFNQGWYGGGVATGWPTTRTSGLPTDQKESNVQAGFRGDFEGFGRDLEYDLSVAWSESSIEQEVSTLMRDRTELAINGLGGANCTPNGRDDINFMALPDFAPLAGIFDLVFPNYVLNTLDTSSLALTSTNHGRDGCQFFNPYLSALSDPNLANSAELVDWMDTRILRADKRNQLFVIDAIVNGDIGEMAGGTAAFATGFQYRQRNASGRAPEINLPGLSPIKSHAAGLPFPQSLFAPVTERYSEITNNLECANCIFNFNDQRDIRSVFVELSLPWAENVETQVALRYEDYEDIGSALSPKVALSWRPVEELLLRASWSESFRAPNIGVVNQAFEANGTSIQDPLRNQSVRAGLLPAIDANAVQNSSYTRGAPNPDLDPEYADTFNIGVQWTPSGNLDGLSIGADIWRFEVEDRVLPLVPRAAINPEIAKFNSVVGDESNYILNDTIPLDSRGPDGFVVPCSPSALATEYGADSNERLNCVVNPAAYVVDGVQRSVNDENAGLTTLILPAVNAGTYEVQGIDFKAGYTWNNDWGTFRVGVDYTHIDEFVVDIPGLELGLQATGKMDAAGGDGEQNIVRPVPDNRGNITFSWARENHRVSVFNRHTGSLQVLGHRDYMANPNTAEINKGYAKSMTDSYNTWDVQYNYTRDWGDSTSIFTVGVIDATNEDVPLFRRQSYHTSVFDPRGRRWYARVLWQF
ncbi:MAG: TonB-dependent receptor domain-containing protein [Pseudohongiellaceae bacterium]